MKLYDSKNGLAYFEGNRLRNSDLYVFHSFKRAKRKAIMDKESQIKILQKELDRLKAMTEENCPEKPNPFIS